MNRVDSSMLQASSAPSVQPSSRSKGLSVRWVTLLFLAVCLLTVGAFLTAHSSQEQTAAEQAARAQIQSLGGLLLTGDNGQHVGSVNLSLTRDQQSFDKAMKLVGQLHWLQVLDVTRKPVTTEQLSRLSHLADLNSLHLAYSDIDDQVMNEVAKFKSLTALHLKGTRITDKSLDLVGTLSDLAVLDISETQIAGDLSQLRGLPKLAWLVMRKVPVNDATIDNLASLPALGRLSLEEDQMTDEQLQKIRRLKPQIIVDGADEIHAEHEPG